MEGCKYCSENDNATIKRVVVTYEYTNPNAYGYPQICDWKESYKIDVCPICHRKLNNLK